MGNIFLHFLNRELLRSIGQAPPLNLFDPEIRVLYVATDALLFSNFANTIEGNYLKSELFRELIANDAIKFYAEKQNIEEFWITRESRYKFDRNRYPYITETMNGEILMKPFIVRSFSMTDQLKINLFQHTKSNIDNKPFLGQHSGTMELNAVIKSLHQHEGPEAMTMSLASTFVSDTNREVNKTLLVNSAGRLLAYYYLKETLANLNADIATGLAGLSLFEGLADNFPSYDIFLLRTILKNCGINILNIPINKLIEFRNSPEHQPAILQIAQILSNLSNLIHADYTLDVKRLKIFEILSSVVVNGALNENSLEKLPINLHQLGLKLERQQQGYHEVNLLNKSSMKSIIILTATNKESKAVLKLATKSFGSEADPSPIGNHVVSFLGILNSYKIYHAQCEAGSTGPSSSQAVANDLIVSLQPLFILMPGIAFGLKPDEQKIGDILVSTHVCSYERQRISEKETLSRGEKVPSSPLLLSLLRTVSHTWSETDIHFGVLMSGEKLVDSSEFVEKLKSIEPEAIGGEMEGAGLYASAHRNKVDWIVFKSIVDWGMGKTDNYQGTSASLATKVLFKALTILTKV